MYTAYNFWYRLTNIFLAVVVVTAFATNVIFAARPFDTDDADTIGRGVFQIETGAQIHHNKEIENGIETKERVSELSVGIGYGIFANLDLVLEVPYLYRKIKEDGITVYDEKGISDVSIEAKWKLYQAEGVSFSVKPGLTIPSGDYEKGLGTGKATWGLNLILSRQISDFALHINAGYTKNSNKVGEVKNLLSASTALTLEILKHIVLGVDFGISSNTDPYKNNILSYFMLGGNYKLTDRFTLDTGIKWLIDKDVTDRAYIFGVTVVF